MYTKIIALVIQAYFISKSLSPPNKTLSTDKVMSTEGITGFIVAKIIPKLSIITAIVQLFIYTGIMYQQETGALPIKHYRFADWSLLEVVLFLSSIGGCLLRLWCFECLKEFFTFSVTIKKDHKLITTGPYSLLVHPAVSYLLCLSVILIILSNYLLNISITAQYTGSLSTTLNMLFLWYQICSYIPIYYPLGPITSFIWNKILFSWWNITIQIILNFIIFYKRVSYEEGELKKNFGKEWDVYLAKNYPIYLLI
jgi:protein-S-isoprenylcysteine O-methyltransferase Ste14